MDRDRRAREVAMRAALARMADRHASARSKSRGADRCSSAAAVPELIEKSWRRSLGAGLDPGVFRVPHRDVPSDTSDLVRLARPVLDRLADTLDGTGVGLVLGDADGTVLHRWTAERGLLSQLDQINLAPGFEYGESSVGTNAIGTALAQRAPSYVAGGQHFADELMGMVCAAVPLIDPASGRVVGFLDATSRAGQGHPLMLTLVQQAAAEIRQLLDTAGFRRSGIPDPDPNTRAVLTPTERAVADGVVRGLTNHAVARRLTMSPHTVDTHLRHIYSKLGVRSRGELAHLLLAGAVASD